MCPWLIQGPELGSQAGCAVPEGRDGQDKDGQGRDGQSAACRAGVLGQAVTHPAQPQLILHCQLRALMLPHSHSTWREANQATPCLVLPANICPEYLRGALSLLQTLNTIPWLCFVGSRNPGEVLEVNNPHYGRQSAGNL